ncbi:hypothetical protein EDF59_16015 [Novosphingobium sp. ST904]|nr:hypothetical protein EDF59_16015 [Novosphingobium sp. ST904]
MIRLHLITGPVVTFTNFIDLIDYVVDRMVARGEL